MDPTVTLREALEALLGNDLDTAAELLEELVAWLRRGGFAPHLEELEELVARAVRIGAAPALELERYELRDANDALLGSSSTLEGLALLEPWLGEQAYAPAGAAEMWLEDLAREESDGWVAATAVDGALVWIVDRRRVEALELEAGR